MKNIYFYYTAILLPLAVMLFLMRTNNINLWGFVIFMMLYSLVYRTYIDGLRLVSKGIIERSEIWGMIYKGRRFQYFKELYLK